MHMVSKTDLDSAELETMKTSRNPTTVMTANGEVQTKEEATVYVKELDLFVTVTLLEETPAVLSLGKLCEDHGYTYQWTSGQKPHLTKKGKRIDCNISNFSSSSSSSQDSVFDVNRYTEIQYSKEVEVRVRSFEETCSINQQKPKTIIKIKDAKKYKAIYCMTFRIGCRISKKIWSMNVVPQSHGKT